jgi:AraC-like DNA-binding protein
MARGEEAGLERSCGDHLRLVAGPHGLALLAARFVAHAYDRHRHETYAIGVTLSGVQEFSYRGALRASLPGRVIVIAPDEPHDGHAGSEAGFAYRMLYVDPRRIAAALDGYAGRAWPLPGGGAAVDEDRALAAAVGEAFARFPQIPDAFATDGIVQAIADSLLRRERAVPRRTRRPIDLRAVERARALMEEEDPVTAAGLESATGLDRFTLARQFRARFGTSPHRYWMACRQRRARSLIQAGAALAEAALQAGFADQPHMTREFKAGLGMAPGRFRRLLEAGRATSRTPSRAVDHNEETG